MQPTGLDWVRVNGTGITHQKQSKSKASPRKISRPAHQRSRSVVLYVYMDAVCLYAKATYWVSKTLRRQDRKAIMYAMPRGSGVYMWKSMPSASSLFLRTWTEKQQESNAGAPNDDHRWNGISKGEDAGKRCTVDASSPRRAEMRRALGTWAWWGKLAQAELRSRSCLRGCWVARRYCCLARGEGLVFGCRAR
jgi:hypothetical protein